MPQPEEVKTAVDGILADHQDIPASNKLGVFRVTDDTLFAAPKYVEFEEFARRLGQTNEQMAERYGAYDEKSVFWVVIDIARRWPVGALRIIQPLPDMRLKCFEDFERDVKQGGWGTNVDTIFSRIGANFSTDISRSWEIATISVNHHYSSGGEIGGPSVALYHACIFDAIASGVEYLFAIQEQRPFELVQRLGEPFNRIPGLEDIPHEGTTLNAATYLSTSQAIERLRSFNPAVASLVLTGSGLEQIFYMPHLGTA